MTDDLQSRGRDPRSSLHRAFTRYRILAWATGVVLGALTIWLVLGYGFWDYANVEAKPALYRYLWTAHGWLYFIYLIVSVDLVFRLRLSVARTLAVLLAGTVPFMSFVAEVWMRKVVQVRLAAMPSTSAAGS